MWFSELDIETLTDQQITELMFYWQDDGAKGDLIFVAGSEYVLEYRMPMAEELYFAGRAPRVLLAGGVQWPGQDTIEALRMEQNALAAGIPPESLLLESQSHNTLENVRFSKKLISEELGWEQVQRVLIVTNGFHMNRLYRIMKTYFPEQVEYSFCGAKDVRTRKENWFTSKVGRSRIMNELEGLQAGIKSGRIADYQVVL